MPASRAGSRGRAYSGAAACRSLWAGKPPVAARRPARRPRSRRQPVPAPTLADDRVCASWPGRPPRARHSLAAQRSHSRALRPAASASVAPQPQTLECDLPRQDPGTYQEDGAVTRTPLIGARQALIDGAAPLSGRAVRVQQPSESIIVHLMADCAERLATGRELHSPPACGLS